MLEFELIKTFFDRGPARKATLGIGDDCALVDVASNETLAISTDMLVEGRHFFADVSPRSLGHKALAVNLSDLAAMGAQAMSFTLGLSLPQADSAWLREFSQGMFELADRYECELIGGDTTQGPLVLSLTVMGRLPRGVALRRDGAQVGDDIWVSGRLGGPYYAVRERYAAIDAMRAPFLAPFPTHVPPACIIKLERPEPRLSLGVALRHLASSAIDISDGLLGEVGHLCERSRCGARIRVDQIPLCDSLSQLHPSVLPLSDWPELLLAGGDEYELCFTAATENRAHIRRIAQDLGLPLTIVGEMTAGGSIDVVDQDDRPVMFHGRAHQHFAS
jgi:thiamine-monophosphate kinase